MNDRRNLLQESLAAIERLQARLDASEQALHQPIAIIGAGCRYPGGIESPDDLWRTVRDGVNAVQEVPADRWDINAYYDPDPGAPGKMVTRRGGFLKQVDRFDAQFFGISPREAATLDPQQRLLLETSYEAMETAGLAVDRLSGSLTGVFVGITTSDYGQLTRLGGPESSDVYSATGTALNAAAGRIAFTFGFQGPCVSLDTACSSSLVAVHMACQSLRTGESNLALAGGVNVVLAPDAMILFSKWGMMAPDGACKTFDAAADGFVRAEGCAVIALKRLSEALAAGDPILAVIRGSAVNSDGRSSGLTVPNGPAQEAVLRAALKSARLAPADIDYVEAHGTGTSLGDPIEVEALGAVMAEGRSADRPLLIGSIKTNLGHTEAASGLAGLLKVVMSLRHAHIPPHLHFKDPSPGIRWEQYPVRVPTRLASWPSAGPARRAGVSSFGFSGTNAHVVLEEAPSSRASEGTIEAAAAHVPRLVIPLSARTGPALRELAARYAQWLQTATETPPGLCDVAATLANGRAHYAYRAAVVASSSEELAIALQSFASGDSSALAAEGNVRQAQPTKVAFVFTGQGSQYGGMARELYASEPVFRQIIDRAQEILRPFLPRPLTEALFAQDGTELGQTAYTQPALFALQHGLAEVWRAWGVKPAIVLGHSVGEYSAACAAGVFSFDEGLKLIAERAQLMQALPAGGAMAAVYTSDAKVAPEIAAHATGISIAAINGPEETVLSGDAHALKELLAVLAAKGIGGKLLDVSHAFHSHRLDPMLDQLAEAAGKVRHARPAIPLVSNISGEIFAAGTGPDASYWRRHAREPVRFAASIEALRRSGVGAVVEIGPHPTLLGLIGRAAPDATWASIASLRRGRDSREQMFAAVAELYVRGARLEWSVIGAAAGGRRIAAPTYPFQRERHWLPQTSHSRIAEPDGTHPLLGRHSALAGIPGTSIWEREVSLASHPWVADHKVQGSAILPATAYIEMAFAAARTVFGDGSLRVWDIENLKPTILHEGTVHRLQTMLTMEPDQTARFSVYGKRVQSDGVTSAQPWIEHLRARVERAPPAADASGVLAKLQADASTRASIPGRTFYSLLENKGNQWGPAFQGMQELWRGDRETFARVEVAAGLAREARLYGFHPAISDACGHVLVGTVSLESSMDARGGAFVGGGVGEVRFHKSPATSRLWAHARLHSDVADDGNTVIGDVMVYDDSGAIISETLNARLWYLDEKARENSSAPPDWFYEQQWLRQDRTGDAVRAPKPGPWLMFADETGLAARIAESRARRGLQSILVRKGTAFMGSPESGFTIRSGVADDYAQLMRTVPKPAAILHLWSLGELTDGSSAEGSGEPLNHAPESALQLLHAIRTGTNPSKPRLWFVTRDAQPAVPADRVDAPWNASVWGLGRSMSAEHAELWGGLIDLDAAAVRDAAEALAAEIEHPTADDKVAFRGRDRFVARLERYTPSGEPQDVTVRRDGTYLVTGGLGGIGLVMAQWLAQKGAAAVVLLGRSALPPRESWQALDRTSAAGRKVTAIEAMEKLGSRVDTAALDISDAGALRSWLERYKAANPAPVRGVIHAAGVLRFATLESQSIEGFREAVAAKVQGAWNLHQLLAREPLDLFVQCSSTSSILSSPLLGAYAAGNAFLDALGHHRRSRGLAALAINWGTWSEVGMAVESGRSASGDMLAGVGTIPTARGLAALEHLLTMRATQAAVMPIDWQAFASAYPAFAGDPFFSTQTAGSGLSGASGAAKLSVANLRRMSPDERPAAIVQYLRGAAAVVMGFKPERIETSAPLSSFGFDSLMAVQLKNRIDADLAVSVPMIEFLQGPSIEELAGVVLAGIEYPDPEGLPEQAAPEPAESWEEGAI